MWGQPLSYPGTDIPEPFLLDTRQMVPAALQLIFGHTAGLLTTSCATAALGTTVTYGSQGWYLPEYELVLTVGSYGQVGFSDLESGLSVVFMQDWEDNGVTDKLADTVARALLVIENLGSQ